jgi:DNA-binding NarL/FixJ family response regulator
MLRVIIADDHPVVRAGLKQVLSESPDVLVAGEADDGEALLRKIQRQPYDVVLLDITMPGIGGLETLRRVKEVKPGLPVLMLSIHTEDQFAIRCLKAGAAGYLNKASAPHDLVAAIRQVAGGRRYITSALSEKLVAGMAQNRDMSRLPHEWLSDREYQVLCMIASGKTVSDIAATVNLSVKTVSTYRARILEKMAMESNAELTAYAIKNGIC